MSQDKLSKRESIKNALIAATGLGLSMATMSAAIAQPKPTAAPPVNTSPGPTTVPRLETTYPTAEPRGQNKARAVTPAPAKKTDK